MRTVCARLPAMGFLERVAFLISKASHLATRSTQHLASAWLLSPSLIFVAQGAGSRSPSDDELTTPLLPRGLNGLEASSSVSQLLER